jgi:hypothetical protein
MSRYPPSNACSASTWTLEELTTLTGGSAATEQGDTPQYGLLTQGWLEEFTEGYGGQTHPGISMNFDGLRSPTSTSLAAVGGQFSDGQPAGQMGFSGSSILNLPIKSNVYVPTDSGIAALDTATCHTPDQFSSSNHPKRRRVPCYQLERNNRPSRRDSRASAPMSIELSSGSTSTVGTGYSGRRKGPENAGCSGGRRGPLTQEQRQHAKIVRARRACWRCHSLNTKVRIPLHISNPCS